MKEYFINMMSASSDVSHKRFISISAFVVLTCISIANIIGANVDYNLIYTFAALSLGQSITTTLEKK